MRNPRQAAPGNTAMSRHEPSGKLNVPAASDIASGAFRMSKVSSRCALLVRGRKGKVCRSRETGNS